MQGLVNIFIVKDQETGNLSSSQEEMEILPLPTPAPSFYSPKESIETDF